MDDYKAFTLTGHGILNKLLTRATVLSDIRVKTTPYEPKQWVALWDTGATHTCISRKIAKDLSLIPIGSANMSTANGIKITNTYRIDLLLPNQVIVEKVIATEAELGQDCDMLIGMDIIKFGDFSITNCDQQTKFSFRMPSICHTDYVLEYNMAFEEQRTAQEQVATARSNIIED